MNNILIPRAAKRHCLQQQFGLAFVRTAVGSSEPATNVGLIDFRAISTIAYAHRHTGNRYPFVQNDSRRSKAERASARIFC